MSKYIPHQRTHFEKAFHQAEIAAMTSGEYDNYQKSLMEYIEIREVVNTAVESEVKLLKKTIQKRLLGN